MDEDRAANFAKELESQGGSAFPFPCTMHGGLRGMSLRDYFAAAAMQALMAQHTTAQGIAALELTASRSGVKFVAVVPALAYEMADAMIAERAK